jgi:hypothetical protein
MNVPGVGLEHTRPFEDCPSCKHHAQNPNCSKNRPSHVSPFALSDANPSRLVFSSSDYASSIPVSFPSIHDGFFVGSCSGRGRSGLGMGLGLDGSVMPALLSPSIVGWVRRMRLEIAQDAGRCLGYSCLVAF